MVNTVANLRCRVTRCRVEQVCPTCGDTVQCGILQVRDGNFSRHVRCALKHYRELSNRHEATAKWIETQLTERTECTQ